MPTDVDSFRDLLLAEQGRSFYDSSMPTFEIVILTYRRMKMLMRCLASLNASVARLANGRVRAIVVVNGRDEETTAKLELVRSHLVHLEIEVLTSDERLPCGFARNFAVEQARANWIYFADDDAWVADDFFELFLEQARSRIGLAVIGGPNVTADSMTSFQKTVGAVLGSRFAAGPFSRRYRAGGEVETAKDDRGLILCNLFVKRTALAHYRFPRELSCAEENHMLHYLDSEFPSEGKLFHPSLAVFHERANDLERFASSALRYGRGRGELISVDGWSMKSSKFFLIGAFVVALGGLLAPLASLGLYGLALAAHAMTIAVRTRNPFSFFVAPVLTLALHTLYPMGVVSGILRTPVRSFRSMSAPILAASAPRPRFPRSRSRD